jgi:hypothetical protein
MPLCDSTHNRIEPVHANDHFFAIELLTQLAYSTNDWRLHAIFLPLLWICADRKNTYPHQLTTHHDTLQRIHHLSAATARSSTSKYVHPARQLTFGETSNPRISEQDRKK